MATEKYPTWKKVNYKRLESEEGQWGTPNEHCPDGWIPDFLALKTSEGGGWWLKVRTSGVAMVGFATIQEIKDYVRSEYTTEKERA